MIPWRNRYTFQPLYASYVHLYFSIEILKVCGLVLVTIDKKYRPALPILIVHDIPDQKPTNISIDAMQMSVRSQKTIRPFDNIFEMYPKYGVKKEEVK